MKKSVAILILAALACSAASARDDVESYSVSEALSIEKFKAELGTDIGFYFGETPHGKVEKNFGEYGTNKKTNAFNKTDKEACQWAFLSAMKTLKERAMREGGNAVIEIKSNYRNNLTSSNDTFQCGAGALMAGVALTGKVVKIGK